MSTPDAIVVGSGHNGLAAANLLADAGWDVLVLEARPRPGGAVQTEQVAAPGFHSDLFSAFYPLSAVSPVLRGFGLEEWGLRWRRSPSVLSHVLPDGRSVTLHEDLDATARSVEAFAPGDGGAWRELFAEWERVGDAVVTSLLSTFPPVRGGIDLLRALGSSAELLRFMRFGVLSARRLAEERFAGEGARLLIAGNALHSDLTPESALSGLFGWLLAMLGQDVGFPVPEGGAERLVDALVARLRSRGAQVRCEATVTGIEVAGGRATGVRLADGEVIRARHAVLADVPAPTLYRSMISPEHLPPRLLQDLEKFQWDNGTVKVDWALSAPVPWTQPDVRGSGTVHLGADLDGLTRYGASLAVGDVPEKPFMLFGQMATADPSRCPEGSEVAWGYTHVPWGRPLSGQDVQRVVDRMEAAVERAAPGFTGNILGRYVAGPVELEATNPSLVRGAINSGTTAMHQQLFFRPIPGLGRPETPIRGLYLASASAHPGGGVHGACGGNAARVAILRRRPHGVVVDTGLHWALRRLYRDRPALVSRSAASGERQAGSVR